MAGIIVADAVSGAPDYVGSDTRALFTTGQLVGDPARPLASLSGVKPGTPASVVTVAGSTYTVHPHAGQIDAEASVLAAAYPYIFTTNQTGTVNAAHATLPRVDLLSVQINDPPQDSTAVPQALVVYTPGTANASPTAPGTPARNMPLAYINVPPAGGGASTISFIAPQLGAGIVTVPAGGTYPANPFVGQYVDDQSTKLLMRWNGTVWVPFLETDFCRVTRTATLAGVDSSGSRPSAWDTVYSLGPGFTASTGSGPIVANFACNAFWNSTVPFPTGTGMVAVYVEINGTAFASGRQSSPLSGSHQSYLTAGGYLHLSAGDSVQLVVAFLDGTLTTVTPMTFGMTRVG